MSVFERSRLMLAGVTDEVSFLHTVIQYLVPFHTGGKAGAATPAEPGGLEFLDDLFRSQFFDAFLPGLVSADLDVRVDVPRGAIDLFHEAGVGQRHHQYAPRRQKAERVLYGAPSSSVKAKRRE